MPGPTPKRSDPAESPIDCAPDRSSVAGKDEAFKYVWLHPDDIRKGALNRKVVDGQSIGGYAKCKAGEESEEFAGYGSVRDGSPMTTDIVNAELVLCKRPWSEERKLLEVQEAQNRLMDNRGRGHEAQGAPVRADVSERVLTQ